jgi:hypothetical protein
VATVAEPEAAPAQPYSWLVRGVVIALAVVAVTLGRAVVESRSQLAAGARAEATGDGDGALLHYGEARLWRMPPWSRQAEARLAALAAHPRAALGGSNLGTGAAAVANSRFGRVPAPALALSGGLALLAALGAAAAWAWTARWAWVAVTLAGGLIAAVSLWVA